MDFAQLNYLWLDAPHFEQLLRDLQLPEEEVAMIRLYREQGYLIVRPGADDMQIDRIVNDPSIQYAGAAHETKRALNTWRNNADIRALACLPEVERILRLLYRREPIPFQSINFNVGSEKKAHSDAIHFNSFPEGFMCGVWMALEDIHEGNGPIELYPGSHRLPYATMLDVGKCACKAEQIYDFYEDYERYAEWMIQQHQLKPVQIHLKKGEAIIWAANMLHAGAPIKDKSKTRYSQVTHFYFENCVYYGPLFSDIPLGKIHYWELTNIKTGAPVQHRYMGMPVDIYPGKMKRMVDALTYKKPENFIY